MKEDEAIAMSRITHSPNVTRWNDTENLQWSVAEGFVREARGKCLSVVSAGAVREEGRTKVVASEVCGAAQKWDSLPTGELKHHASGGCLGVW
jgi:hypothetical protein